MRKRQYSDKETISAQKRLTAIFSVVSSRRKSQQHHKYFVNLIYNKSGPFGRVKQVPACHILLGTFPIICNKDTPVSVAQRLISLYEKKIVKVSGSKRISMIMAED